MGRGRGKLIVLVTGTMLFALAGWTSPAQAVRERTFQVLLNADGSGKIFVNNGAKPSWKACRPDLSECTPFASGGEFDTTGAPPNTVFWGGEDILTPIWKGTLRSTAPPSVQGTVRGNEVVTPVAGQWEGGWEDDYDSLAFSICKTAAGTGCLNINYEGQKEEACGPGGAVMIDPAFAGRYLRVTDRRYGAGTIFAGVGHPTYYPSEKLVPTATTSVAIVGKIAPATGPPHIRCGPDPLIGASINKGGIAEVTCRIVGCHAVLIVRSGSRVAHLTKRIRPTDASWRGGTANLRLSPSALSRFAGSRVRVTVKIDGKKAAARTVALKRMLATAKRGLPEAQDSAAAAHISVTFNDDGSGTLTAEPSGNWEWKNCAPDLTGCVPAGTGTQISTGGAAEGTLFTATLAARTLISPKWNGNVYFAKAPGVKGTARANEFVAPEAGDWRGGWARPTVIGTTQLAACRNADGSDCLTLSSSHVPCIAQGAQVPAGAALDPVLTGWYLRVAQRVEFVGSSPAYIYPEEEAPFAANGLTSVVMAGQIAPATGARSVDCGVPPQLQASISKAGVVTVRCGLGCHAVVLVSRRGSAAQIVRDIAPTPFRQSKKLLPRARLSRALLAQLGSGKAKVTVKLDGQRVAQRTVNLPPR
jgi:hypothetical protein